MKRLLAIATAAWFAAADVDAQNRTTESQARSYILSAFVTGAAHGILSADVALSAQLRERLTLPRHATLSGQAKASLYSEGLPKIAAVPAVRYVVRGHSDRLESPDYNWRLSERRAEGVRDYLIAQGVPAENIELRAFGHLMSLTSCAQADRGVLIACLAPDRSVTVQVLPPPR